MRSADVLVVGAGAAGAVLAARLSEDPARRVLLLEAGGRDSNPVYRVPVMTGLLAQSRFGLWTDHTAPEPALAQRELRWPHGRVVGGSTAINGMVWMRGRPSDFERWASAGLPEWRWETVRRAYAKIERDPADPLSTGPVTVMRHAGGNPLYETFIEAGLQAGHPASADLNRGAQEGVGRLSVNIGRGRRQSASQAYLVPARARRNLEVITHACVHEIRLEGSRAVGVSALVRGTATQFSAGHIVLCGGAVNSPHLLLLSGIGAPEELERQGIAVRHALPGVGQNLQDHVCVRLAYESREPITLHSLARLDRALVGFLNAWLRGSGPAATTPFGAGFLLRSDPAEPEPDLEGVFLPVLTTAGLWAPWFLPAATGHGFVGTVYGLRPESRGRIALQSPDPRRRPLIFANYLSTARDRSTLRRGVRLLREVFAQRAFDRYRGRTLFTSRDDDASLDAAIAESATSAYHPVGSCRMGPASDAMAVVDARLRVRGIDGLSVADASVMPTLTSGNTNAPTMMIGYRCAEFLIGG